MILKTKKIKTKKYFFLFGIIPFLKVTNSNINLFFIIPLYNFVTFFFNFLPIRKNRILFWNMDGQGYGDNPKYIAKEMIERKCFDLIWLYNKDKLKHIEEFPQEIKLIEYRSIKALYYLATYNFFISNVRQKLLQKNGLQKKKNQIYIHTWHGNFAFKKIEAEYPKLSKGYVEIAKKDSKQIDYLCSGSKWSEDRLFKETFWYNGRYFRGGNPRNDILFNPTNNVIQKIQSYFQIKKSQKILLYAPTFRDNYEQDIYKLDYKKIKETLEKKFKGEWIILSRLHPNMINKKNTLPKYSWLIDATNYPDMQELLVGVDILITDYSSSIFDFLNTEKPAFIFAPDKDYYEKERGFVITYSESPFSVALNNETLITNILNFDQQEFSKQIKTFLDDKKSYDKGNASKELVDFILNKTNKIKR